MKHWIHSFYCWCDRVIWAKQAREPGVRGRVKWKARWNGRDDDADHTPLVESGFHDTQEAAVASISPFLNKIAEMSNLDEVGMTPLPQLVDGRVPCPTCNEKSDLIVEPDQWECPACGTKFNNADLR